MQGGVRIQTPNSPLGIVFDHDQNLYAIQKAPDEIVEYSKNAAGKYHQTGIIEGPATGLDDEVEGLTFYKGFLFGTQFRDPSVSEFPAGATGNIPPIHRISGPNTDLCPPVGMEYLVQAYAGLAEGLTPVGEAPRPTPMLLVDAMGGLVAAEGVLAALLRREHTGQ